MLSKRINRKSTLGENTNTFLSHKHLLRKCLGDWLPAVWGPFLWNENQMWLLPSGGKNNTWKSEQHLSCDFQESGTWVPPFKLEESSMRVQSQAGGSGLHCQLVVQSPRALKVRPPRWSTQWCPCRRNDSRTGSHSCGLSPQMPRTPCFCWASVHCGRNGDQMSWRREGSSCLSHPTPVPDLVWAVISLETPAPISPTC